MVSKTEMLEALSRVHYRITEVLYDWTLKEGNNLEGFINNPSGHVDYNPYVVVDFSALTKRLEILRITANDLDIITRYKKGSPDVTKTMHDLAIERIPLQLTKRLEDWLLKRKTDMYDVVQSSGNTIQAPIDDYSSLFSFNYDKFMVEYNMYVEAYEGIVIINQYKLEQIQASAELNETPIEEPKDETTEA
jgi:hypothetical protein